MLDRLLNNRKEWNALKEEHEAKLAALEEAKKAKEEATQKVEGEKQGKSLLDMLTHTENEKHSMYFMYDILTLS